MWSQLIVYMAAGPYFGYLCRGGRKVGFSTEYVNTTPWANWWSCCCNVSLQQDECIFCLQDTYMHTWSAGNQFQSFDIRHCSARASLKSPSPRAIELECMDTCQSPCVLPCQSIYCYRLPKGGHFHHATTKWVGLAVQTVYLTFIALAADTELGVWDTVMWVLCTMCLALT